MEFYNLDGKAVSFGTELGGSLAGGVSCGSGAAVDGCSGVGVLVGMGVGVRVGTGVWV
ncbi:hypothetical protein HW132_18670, partial [Brasilonema sp. CT11]|nr:hypothetical protein [Brasilonema sp. CT11]